MKIPGIIRRDITVDFHEDSRQIVVWGQRHSKLTDNIDYWAFAMPEDADPDWATMRFREDTLEIVIPRRQIGEAA